MRTAHLETSCQKNQSVYEEGDVCMRERLSRASPPLFVVLRH